MAELGLRRRTVTEEEFIDCIAGEFDLSPVPSAKSLLVEELGFDSVDMVNLVAYVEELAEVSQIPDADIYPVIRTVGEAYSYLLDVIGEEDGNSGVR